MDNIIPENGPLIQTRSKKRSIGDQTQSIDDQTQSIGDNMEVIDDKTQSKTQSISDKTQSINKVTKSIGDISLYNKRKRASPSPNKTKKRRDNEWVTSIKTFSDENPTITSPKINENLTRIIQNNRSRKIQKFFKNFSIDHHQLTENLLKISKIVN